MITILIKKIKKSLKKVKVYKICADIHYKQIKIKEYLLKDEPVSNIYSTGCGQYVFD